MLAPVPCSATFTWAWKERKSPSSSDGVVASTLSVVMLALISRSTICTIERAVPAISVSTTRCCASLLRCSRIAEKTKAGSSATRAKASR